MRLIFNKSFFFFLLVLSFSSFAFAQNEREAGIKLYKGGDYKGAIKVLKQAAKGNSGDAAEVLYFLGLAYFQTGKSKEAQKAFAASIKLKPEDSRGYIGMAYVQYSNNKISEAATSARKAVELNNQSFEAHYLLGLISLEGGFYNVAYDRADLVIKINPNYAEAYLLKAEALTLSFAQTSGAVLKSQKERVGLLKEAALNMEKYLSLSTNDKEKTNQRERFESLKFFADYYEKPENQPQNTLEPNPLRGDNFNDIKIISKPRAQYTDAARNQGISGSIRLLIELSGDAKIKSILVLRGLGGGLTAQAIKAAKQIKFEPATKDGQPISVVKIIEYSFTIY